jgi:ABC-2 type transport system permease protein
MRLLKLSIINSYQIQSAYFFENVMGIFSTLAFTFSMLVFINVIFSNVDLFAGYTKSEMLFLFFVAQFNFYVAYIWSVNNINSLVENVRSGELDLILVKPIPDLFFISSRRIHLLTMLKEGLPTLFMFGAAVEWSKVPVVKENIPYALLIIVLGQLSVHCFRLIFGLSVFFTGNAEQVFKLSNAVTDISEIPYEGYPFGLRMLFTAFVPALIASQVAVSVALGKSQALHMLVLVLVISMVFILLANFCWRVALKGYTSASS